jgi:tRNA threonylcarbamoyladenosine biosynthesis protein TsaE
VHADLYRIERPDELRELGLEAGYDLAATALEWADRFPEVLPEDRLEIVFAVAAGGRRLLARATGPRARVLLAAW